MTAAPLRIIAGTDAAPVKAKSVEANLRDLLRREQVLIRKLAEVRAGIGPAKRAYQEKHRCFGMRDEALMRELGVKQ